jgi:excisionase family DNA binding protein
MIHRIHSNHPRRTSSLGPVKQGLEVVPISSAPVVFLTRSEVSKLLGVSPNTITRWAREGRLPCQLTLGGHHRFERELVLKLRQSLCRAGIGLG